jgi:WhiB family redox-sensing transcriptional regulator
MGMTFVRVFEFDDDEWRGRAACRDSDPDLFFPVGSSGTAVEEIQAAKAVCGTCTVRPQCLAFALESNQEAGVWGGLDEEERRRLRRNRGPRPRPALVPR